MATLALHDAQSVDLSDNTSTSAEFPIFRRCPDALEGGCKIAEVDGLHHCGSVQRRLLVQCNGNGGIDARVFQYSPDYGGQCSPPQHRRLLPTITSFAVRTRGAKLLRRARRTRPSSS